MRYLVYLVMAALMAGSLNCVGHRGVPKDYDTAEQTFWKLCYNTLGEIEDFDGDCEDPREVTWRELPVKVYIAPGYPYPGQVLEAMNVWDAWLGTDVFKLTFDQLESNVTVTYEEEVTFYAGIAQHRRLLESLDVYFNVAIAGKYSENVEVITHEFGHVMGLFHDSGRPRSIMFPGKAHMPWLTGSDCRALAIKYRLKPPGCRDAG